MQNIDKFSRHFWNFEKESKLPSFILVFEIYQDISNIPPKIIVENSNILKFAKQKESVTENCKNSLEIPEFLAKKRKILKIWPRILKFKRKLWNYTEGLNFSMFILVSFQAPQKLSRKIWYSYIGYIWADCEPCGKFMKNITIYFSLTSNIPYFAEDFKIPTKVLRFHRKIKKKLYYLVYLSWNTFWDWNSEILLNKSDNIFEKLSYNHKFREKISQK